MNWEYDLERLLEELDIYLHIGELDKFSVFIKSLLKEQEDKFNIYAKAINQIDDFFEYRHRGYGGEGTKEYIMDIIDNITEQLKLVK